MEIMYFRSFENFENLKSHSRETWLSVVDSHLFRFEENFRTCNLFLSFIKSLTLRCRLVHCSNKNISSNYFYNNLFPYRTRWTQEIRNIFDLLFSIRFWKLLFYFYFCFNFFYYYYYSQSKWYLYKTICKTQTIQLFHIA